MSSRPVLPHFPGSTALTRLAVYDWEGEDGRCGGSPHMHTASTEAYLVIGGKGRVETLGAAGFEDHELLPGDLLWFSPGIIHRLINEAELDLLVVMQNGGLPEAGDAIMTFLPEILADPKLYAATASLPAPAEGTPVRVLAARERRDAALTGFARLKAAAQRGDRGALDEFQGQAVALIQAKVPGWREIYDQGVALEAATTRGWLDGLAGGDYGHFQESAVGRAAPVSSDRALGMCGLLQTWGTTSA